MTKRAKEINIFNETEIPYSCDINYGSIYDAAFHKVMETRTPDPYQHLADIREEVGYEDDNYIVAPGLRGDQYNKYISLNNTRLVAYNRNNFIVDGIGTLYSSLGGNRDGDTSNGEPDISGNIPGSNNIEFTNDMFALVSYRTANDYYRDITFTGEAYCIKSLQTTIQSNPDYYPPTGGADKIGRLATIGMTAKSLDDSSYTNNILAGIISEGSSIYQAYSDIVFMLNGKTVYYNAGSYYGDSEILSLAALEGHIRRLFMGQEQSVYADIITYINDNMPYGALAINPFNSFFLKDRATSTWDKTPGRDFQDFDVYSRADLLLSEILLSNSILPETRIDKWTYLLHRIPSYPKAFHWFIPFASEDEYNAAMCAKMGPNLI